MNKALALLIVASLLLAGCTELAESDDGETLNIEIDEEIALEKINDFVTVDETESFGITVMYEIDSSAMDDGMTSGLDEDAVITVEMTEAWSPDGYHSSNAMSVDNGGFTISMTTSMTHIGTTMYVSMGYGLDGEPADDATEDEIAEFDMMVATMPEAESFSMVSTTTHSEVIAAMAEATAENSDEMDPMAMLEMIEMIEEYGQFTPADSVDGLQIFDATLDMEAMMADEIPTPDEALEMCDIDGNGGISWTELMSDECDGPDEDGSDDDDALETLFNDADTDSSGELTIDELQDFIDAVTAFYDDEEDMSDDEMPEMPAMKVAFTSTGDIEYFSIEVEEGAEMMMYVLSESKVDEFFADVDAGELVALPFTITDYLDPWEYDDEFYCDDGSTIPMSYVDDGYEDCPDGEDEMGDYYDTIYYDGCTESTDPADSYYECWMDDWLNSDGDIMMSDGYDMDECWEDAGLGGWECEPSDDDWMEITFICGSDGTEIPFEYVNDGDDDCSDGSDEQQYDSDGNEINWFDCMDGNTIWISEVNDGTEDCPDGEDEMPVIYVDIPTFICGSDGTEIPFLYVNDGDDDCPDGSDEQQYDSDGNEVNWFDCMDGSTIWISEVNDGTEDCPDGEDEMPDMDDDHGHGDMPTFICGSDGMEIPFDYVNDGMDDCSDGSDEQQYDSDGNEINWFDCMDGSTIWISEVNDGTEDCPDGEDEMPDMDDDHDHSDDHGDHDGHDHGDDSDDEIVMYVTSDMDFYFEGDMSDYKIELATCEYEDVGGEEIKTCTTVVSVAVADASVAEVSGIMFHDADSSGTISHGDMIHIGETSDDWDEVRLYSISADAYSDENPMHDMPGFTGLVGMLALLGAAFIRRNE